MKQFRPRQIVLTALEILRRLIPRKPRHVDRLAKQRRKRQLKIRKAARRKGIPNRKGQRRKTSFRLFWSENARKAYLPGPVRGRPKHDRKTRRRWVREWYQQERRGQGKQG